MAIDALYWPLTIWADYKWTDTIPIENADGTAYDLTGATVECQVRDTSDKDSDLIKAITCTHDDAGGIISLVQDNREVADSGTGSIDKIKGWMTIVVTESGGTPEPWFTGPVEFEKHPTVPA